MHLAKTLLNVFLTASVGCIAQAAAAAAAAS